MTAKKTTKSKASPKKAPTKKKTPSKRRTTAGKTKAKKAARTNVPIGTVIEKTFKGKAIKVTVTDEGFRYGGKDWKSLTALALHITGYKAVSGPRFFGLVEAKPKDGAK